MVVLGKNKFKEIETIDTWGCCDKCWFSINEGVDCLELREKGLLPPCSEYHREDGRSIIFADEFANLSTGSSFKYEDKELIVRDVKDCCCKGCYFEQNKGLECDNLRNLGVIPYCSKDHRIDNKNVVFTERKKKAFISHPMKDVEDVEKFRADVIAKTRKVLGNNIEIIDTLFTDEGMAPSWYLGKSIMAMDDADVVVFYKGWDKARGCIIEHEVALKYGMNIVYVE